MAQRNGPADNMPRQLPAGIRLSARRLSAGRHLLPVLPVLPVPAWWHATYAARSAGRPLPFPPSGEAETGVQVGANQPAAVESGRTGYSAAGLMVDSAGSPVNAPTDHRPTSCLCPGLTTSQTDIEERVRKREREREGETERVRKREREREISEVCRHVSVLVLSSLVSDSAEYM